MLRSHSLFLTAIRNRYNCGALFPASSRVECKCIRNEYRLYSEQQGNDKEEEGKNDESPRHEGIYPLSLPAKQLLASYCSWAGVKPETWDVPSMSSLFLSKHEISFR